MRTLLLAFLVLMVGCGAALAGDWTVTSGGTADLTIQAGSSGDSVSVDSGATTDPDFQSGGDVDFVNTTNVVTANLNADVILETDLNVDNSASDGDILTYDSTGTNFAWITQNAGTDVTADLEEEGHNSEHAVSGGDTVYPTDPNVDGILIWDDNPGTLEWGAVGTGLSYDGANLTITETGDISQVWGGTTGDLSALTAAAGDSLDATLADTTVPWRCNNTAAPTVDGQAVWDADGNFLTIGDGAATTYVAKAANDGDALAGDSATSFFDTGSIERARGGLGTDTSSYGTGLIGSDGSNNTVDVDTEAELETALGSLDVVTITTDDITSANLITAVSNETGSGALVFGTSPSFTTSVALPVDGTVDASGEITIDATDDQLCYYDSAQRVLRYEIEKGFSIESPVDADRLLLFQCRDAITVTRINGIVDPADSAEAISFILYESDGSGDFTDAATNGLDGATAIAADNDGTNDDGTLSNATLDAGDWLGIDMTSAPTGTVTWLTVTVVYTVDRQ